MAQQPVARKASARKKARGGNAIVLFLLFGAAPLGLLTWFFLQPEATRAQMLEQIPEGVGGRAAKAGICLAVLIGLSVVALPAFHGASSALRGVLDKMRTAPMWRRVLMSPIELVLGLLWLVVQVSFAVDVLLIVATSLGLLLATARIVLPDLLPGIAPWL